LDLIPRSLKTVGLATTWRGEAKQHVIASEAKQHVIASEAKQSDPPSGSSRAMLCIGLLRRCAPRNDRITEQNFDNRYNCVFLHNFLGKFPRRRVKTSDNSLLNIIIY
jgi:hypothetical protein